jgi:hypothetical protein
MARSYKRDSNGRFSSSGGGGSRSSGGSSGRSKAAASPKASTSAGSKSAATRKANTARAAELRSKGTTAIGGRVKTKGFAGGKSAQQRAGGLRSSGTTRARGTAFAVGRSGGQSGARKAATSSAMKKLAQARSRGPRGATPPARTNKSPANAAKERYRQLSSTARKSSPFRSSAENRAAAGARRSLQAMERTRGTGKYNNTPKVVKAAVRAAAATFVAGQKAREALTGRRRRKR